MSNAPTVLHIARASCLLALPFILSGLLAACSSSSPSGSDNGSSCEVADDCESGLCIAGECVDEISSGSSDNGLGGDSDVTTDTDTDTDTSGPTEDVEGGLGAQCTSGEDCISGVCLNGADGRFCSDFCDGDCPEGWECRIFSSSGSDFTSYCLPLAPVLCSPCTSDIDCGGLNDLCLDLLDGRFCGVVCDQTDEVPCPDGYSCREMAAHNGGEGVYQCVPDLDICGGCLDLDGDGYGVGPTCLGPDCDDSNRDVNPGMPEICDGRDTNCDGTVDSGFDKTSDINHCGVCDNVCTAPGGTPACVEGECTIESCDEGRENCDGDLETGCEVNLTNDLGNCGTCGWTCEAPRANMVCDNATCAIGSCTDNYDNCDEDQDTGCETLLLANDDHCGACGNACEDFQVCVNGTCVLDNCPAGTGSCDGDDDTGCETTFGSMEHCSRCNDTCTGGEVCDEGTCQCPANTIRCTDGTCAPENACGGCAVLDFEPGTACGTCLSGERVCDGSNALRCVGETSTNSDAQNCGECGFVCPPDTVCFGGQCQCSGGQTLCGITCVNRNTDPENCGSCDNACFFQNATPGCTAGNCVIAGCLEGFRNCDGNQATGCETSVSNDVSNCGSCGNSCNLPNTTSNGCANGQCTIGDCSEGFRNCDGSQATGCETNTQSSSEHCGICGNNCTGGQICSSGTCDCPPGQVLVGGTCTNETTGSVITQPVTNRQQTGARLNAEITSVGTPSVTSRGFCWAAAPMVPALDTAWSTCQTVQGTPTVGTYNLTISGLTAATAYRARAWIRRDTNDPVYGDTIQFSSCQTTDQPNGTDQNCDGVDGQEDIAIFVRSNGSSGSTCGTRTTPCNSITLGIQRAQATGRPHVYVAAGTFAEQVTLPNGISLWGGLNSDFSLWNPESHITHISSANPIGVLVNGRSTAGTLSGFRITAANASGANASSRAIVLRNVTGNFVVEHNDVRPGRGRNGTGGSNGGNGNTGRNGSNGTQGCGGSSACVNEGAGGVGCLSGSGCSNGGNGGRGGHGLNNGGNGVNGVGSSGPVGSTNPGSGGRGGEHRSSCPSNNPAQNGLAGRAGALGSTGSAGAVPSNQNRGSLSGTLDWVATSGLSGLTGGAGIAGGGGGGGGGGRCTTNNRQGGGGGGGGAGGSGGLGGGAGTGGGGSIGILAINASGATVRNNSGQMQLGGTGGVGGAGGFGGSGGSPGAGGPRYNSRAGNGAAGGSGGTGGRGGGGSGGAGGASVGLLMINSGTLTHANNNFTTATPASGGGGGQPNGNTGANGLSVPVLAL